MNQRKHTCGSQRSQRREPQVFLENRTSQPTPSRWRAHVNDRGQAPAADESRLIYDAGLACTWRTKHPVCCSAVLAEAAQVVVAPGLTLLVSTILVAMTVSPGTVT